MAMPKVVPGYREQATERILRAARQVFSEKGYYEARMEDIAERVGVSKRTLYLYFENKEELFAAMCSAEPGAMKEMLQTVLNTSDFFETCKAFFDLAVKQPITGLNFEMIAAASRNPALKKTMRQLYENEMDILTHFLEEMKEKGNVPRNLNTPVLARAIIALYDGLMANILLGLDKSQVREAWLEATSVLVRNLSVKHASL